MRLSYRGFRLALRRFRLALQPWERKGHALRPNLLGGLQLIINYPSIGEKNRPKPKIGKNSTKPKIGIPMHFEQFIGTLLLALIGRGFLAPPQIGQLPIVPSVD